MNTFLEKQNWRYATKKFDSSKKISDADLDFLKEAIRLSASSFGLQPYKVLIIENPELRTKLQPAAWGQSQIVDASHLIIFANQTNIGNPEIDSFINNVSKTRGIPTESLTDYSNYIKISVNPLTEELKNVWTAKQTYIALGNLLNAAAELKIDVTPMEGFDAKAFNEILDLDKQNLNASVIATIGYRDQGDVAQHYKKVRKSTTELFVTL